MARLAVYIDDKLARRINDVVTVLLYKLTQNCILV
jgi:hypothetical protein